MEIFRVNRVFIRCCPDLKIHGRTVTPTGHNSGSRISLIVTYFGLWAALTFLSVVSFSEVDSWMPYWTTWQDETEILYDLRYSATVSMVVPDFKRLTQKTLLRETPCNCWLWEPLPVPMPICIFKTYLLSFSLFFIFLIIYCVYEFTINKQKIQRSMRQ